MQNRESKKIYWEETSIHINNEGIFDHSFANCGFTAILASHFFKPKRVVLAGFDGPSVYPDGIYQEHFNGVARKWEKPQHSIMEKHFNFRKRFLGLILDFLKSRQIEIKILGGLWGMNID